MQRKVRNRFLADRKTTKKCPHCGKKFVSTAGQQRYCKRPECVKDRKYTTWVKYVVAWKKRHPNYWSNYLRKWRGENPNYLKEWRRKHPDYFRNWYRKRRAALRKPASRNRRLKT